MRNAHVSVAGAGVVALLKNLTNRQLAEVFCNAQPYTRPAELFMLAALFVPADKIFCRDNGPVEPARGTGTTSPIWFVLEPRTGLPLIWTAATADAGTARNVIANVPDEYDEHLTRTPTNPAAAIWICEPLALELVTVD